MVAGLVGQGDSWGSLVLELLSLPSSWLLSENGTQGLAHSQVPTRLITWGHSSRLHCTACSLPCPGPAEDLGPCLSLGRVLLGLPLGVPGAPRRHSPQSPQSRNKPALCASLGVGAQLPAGPSHVLTLRTPLLQPGVWSLPHCLPLPQHLDTFPV